MGGAGRGPGCEVDCREGWQAGHQAVGVKGQEKAFVPTLRFSERRQLRDEEIPACGVWSEWSQREISLLI